MQLHAPLALLLCVTAVTAQNTTASTTVDASGIGCQATPGLLTGDVAVEATATVDYNSATGELQLTVANDTPNVAGEDNAVITEIYLNLPAGTVTGATLTSQSGSGGATPNFSLSFDADTAAGPQPNSTACLGNFNIGLDAGNGSMGAIANPQANSISTPNPVTGPVTFTIQLTGPGTAGITAEAILSTISQGGSQPTTFGLKFQGAGVGGQESGFVGSHDECRTAVYVNGPTVPGSSFELCVTGGFGCHACLWVSATPGPSVAGGVTIPIGLPIAGAYDLGNFGLGGVGNSTCVTFDVPNSPLMSGFEFYAVNITYNALNLQGYQFSEPFTVTIN